MNIKDKFYKAFKENKGFINEISLGEKLGLDEPTTREIISQLLSEHKIEYIEEKACNYRLMKTGNRLNLRKGK